MLKPSARCIPLAVALAVSAVLRSAAAQSESVNSRVIGSVPSSEAASVGVLAVSGGKDLLGGASVITALDRTAHVTLWRGGEMLVCQTSVAHLTSGSSLMRLVGKADPILISLDRGAMEIRMPMSSDDILMTPDLRFTAADASRKPAALDLALRVTANGDTCVENRGKKGPTLQIVDSFSQSAYQLKPGQHVLFEHGSLTQVVDHETSPCGCPPATPQSISLAEAAIRGGASKPPTRKQIDKAYPFPEAASEGLAPPSPLPAETPGQVHTQVATTLTYDPADPTSAKPSADAPAPPTQGNSPAALPQARPAQPQRKGVFHSVGGFFKKIFVR